MVVARSPVQIAEPSPRSRRIVGIDIARCLAIFGMFGAHILTDVHALAWNPDTWMALINGRSAILFAVLAGISLAIMTGRETPVTGVELLQARLRIAVRGALIFLIGGILTAFVHPIAVVLEAYGIAFFLALPFVGWKSRRLLWVALGLFIVVPVVRVLGYWSQSHWDRLSIMGSSAWNYLIGGLYPGAVWLGFMVVGLWIGRHNLADVRFAARLLVVGALVAAVAYSAGEWAESRNGINAQEEKVAAAMEQWKEKKAAMGVEENASASASVSSAPALMPITDVPTDGVVCADTGVGLYYCGPEQMLTSMMGSATDGGSVTTGSLRSQLAQLGTWAPHSAAPFESIGSTGFAAAVIGLCLLLPAFVQRLLWPLAAVGSMSLTVYVAHVFAFVWVRDMGTNTWRTYVVFMVAALIGASLWKLALGRGPLERLLAWVSTRASALPRPSPTASLPPAVAAQPGD